jgi:hypothetical protein
MQQYPEFENSSLFAEIESAQQRLSILLETQSDANSEERIPSEFETTSHFAGIESAQQRPSISVQTRIEGNSERDLR